GRRGDRRDRVGLLRRHGREDEGRRAAPFHGGRAEGQLHGSRVDLAPTCRKTPLRRRTGHTMTASTTTSIAGGATRPGKPPTQEVEMHEEATTPPPDRPSAEHLPLRVLVGFDGSDQSVRALYYAARAARRLDSPLCVVTAF